MALFAKKYQSVSPYLWQQLGVASTAFGMQLSSMQPKPETQLGSYLTSIINYYEIKMGIPALRNYLLIGCGGRSYEVFWSVKQIESLISTKRDEMSKLQTAMKGQALDGKSESTITDQVIDNLGFSHKPNLMDEDSRAVSNFVSNGIGFFLPAIKRDVKNGKAGPEGSEAFLHATSATFIGGLIISGFLEFASHDE